MVQQQGQLLYDDPAPMSLFEGTKADLLYGYTCTPWLVTGIIFIDSDKRLRVEMNLIDYQHTQLFSHSFQLKTQQQPLIR